MAQHIKYVGPFAEVHVDGVGFVKNGHTVEVSDDKLAKSLLEQPDNWTAGKKSAASKTDTDEES